jgi:hypothetical protein
MFVVVDLSVEGEIFQISDPCYSYAEADHLMQELSLANLAALDLRIAIMDEGVLHIVQ